MHETGQRINRATYSPTQKISTAPSRGGLIWPYKGLLLVRPLKEARPDFRRYS